MLSTKLEIYYVQSLCRPPRKWENAKKLELHKKFGNTYNGVYYCISGPLKEFAIRIFFRFVPTSIFTVLLCRIFPGAFDVARERLDFTRTERLASTALLWALQPCVLNGFKKEFFSKTDNS
jgi:hypothetical protein